MEDKFCAHKSQMCTKCILKNIEYLKNHIKNILMMLKVNKFYKS